MDHGTKDGNGGGDDQAARTGKRHDAPGTVQKFANGGHPFWKARITLADGHRVWLEPRFPTEQRAREYGAEKTQEARARKLTVAGAASGLKRRNETCDEYALRLAAARSADGLDCTDQDMYRWNKWVSPIIGRRPVARVTRDEVEDVRNSLDDAVRLRLAQGLGFGISGKTAAEIWSVVRVVFKESVSARDRTLRVRTDDPSQGHKGPLKTPKPSKTFLYPIEVVDLLSCQEIPVEWRRIYAIAIWTYLRPEELDAVRWLDVDLTALTISIDKARDGRTGTIKEFPKTSAACRCVPIEPTLLPLLQAMHSERESDEAPIVPGFRDKSDHERAAQFRQHLRLAGVTRARLFTTSVTLLAVNFRSCRDTGLTWLALANAPLPAMQRRAGHEDINTTLKYVKMAEDLSGAIGAPFPAIVECLLSLLRRLR